MLFTFVLLLFATIGFLILLLPALWGREIYNRYAGSRAVICPENHRQVAVRIDALHAARTGLNGPPALRLSDCTRWPERSKCNQACFPQALEAKPYTAGEAKASEKKIYHLPVLLAAFAAWCLGAVWHSQFLFRARWSDAVGFTPSQLKLVVLWYAPHLLTMAACLLFSYGVAWLLAVRGRRGIGQGMVMSIALWAAVALASSPGIASLPRDLLLIEFSYTFLAALLVGAIVGGLTGRLVVPASMAASSRS